jgi:LysM repeat protein
MVTWQAYKTKPNETLPQLAARFGLSLETLRTVNGIGVRSKVPVGHALLVPTQAPSDATVASLQNAVFTTVPSGRTLYHRVRNGETLSSIASHYAVTAQDLKEWNSGMNPKIIAGQRLRVISDVASPGTTSKQRRTTSVRPAHAISKKTASLKPAAVKGQLLPAKRL